MGDVKTNGNADQSSNRGKIIALLVLVAIVAAAIILWPRGPGNLGQGNPGLGNQENGDGQANNSQSSGGPDDAATKRQMELTRAALEATENLEPESADQSWQSLFEISPTDPSLLKNRALNRLLRVDQLSGQATNASLDAATKQQARSKLPDAIAEARAAVDQYAAASSDEALSLWMRTRVDLHEASLLPASMTKSLRREIFTRLSNAIEGPMGKEPDSKILGGSLTDVLTQMEDPIEGLPRDTMAKAVKTLQVLSDRHPDNLFFALRAARMSIESKDPAAAKYVQRSGELARAIEPMVARETRAIGMTPTELVDNIVASIQGGEWQSAETRMLQWFNVLNGTEIVKTDRRLASPHPLDRLSFNSLRKFASAISSKTPIAMGKSPFRFDIQPVDAPESQAIAEAIDFDLDLDADLISIGQDAVIHAFRNDGKGKLESAGSTKLPFVPQDIVIADLFMVDSSSPDRLKSGSTASGRHDTLPCLVLHGKEGVSLVCVDGRTETADENRFLVVDSDTGLSDVKAVVAAVAGDLDSDGDLDLVFATESDGVRMFVNRGNRTFFELPRAGETMGKEDVVTSMAIGDLDRDLDLDLVSTHRSGKVSIFENLLHLQFRGRYLDEIPQVAGASAIAIEEVDGNVSWDLIVGGDQSAAIVFSQTADAGSWTVDHIETATGPSSSMEIVDVDNDSYWDVVTDTSITPIGPAGFGEPQQVTIGKNRTRAADFTGDGVMDLASVDSGKLEIAVNQTESPGHHIDVRFKGIDDNASGRVNHFAIGSVLELRFGPYYRAQIVTSPSTHFGIDGFEDAGSVRAILPNGLTQTIREIKVDTLVEEEQTLKGSCPFLYAWDGSEFQFVTDCLWAAPLGLQVADGIVAKDRPWEYLKIDGTQIRPRDGQYEFRMTEELWEIAYFDEVKLSAIDHPADVEIWTNEKVGPGDIATPTIFAFANEDRVKPTTATDMSGRDVTDKLIATDNDFLQGFDQRIRQGLCPPHWVDLDFGSLPKSGSVHLVMTGWIMPTDTSLNIQIDQNEDLSPIEFPSVWVPDAGAEGGWRNAIPFAGFPGGKTKTIVIDVSDVVDREDATLRIRTSAQIYWDAAEIAVQFEAAEFRQTGLELVAAEVDYHGFSRRVKDGSTRPEVYDYQDVTLSPRWPPLQGKVTRFGDCLDLLRDWDDKMVVIGAGDQVKLTFTVPPGELPEGWVRDFVMHNVGWDKDADLNTLAGQKIGPLPYRSMQAYPPPVDQADESAIRDELNRDHLQRSQSFREFWFRPNVSTEERMPKI